MPFPQFTNKRKVNGYKFYVNKNVQQKYKIIFGLDFLIENKLDFLLSAGVVDWQGVQIAINGNDFTSQDKNEYQNNGKKLNDNAYRKHTSPSVVNHRNVEHLSINEKNALSHLMSQFEGLLKGAVGDYSLDSSDIVFDLLTS